MQSPAEYNQLGQYISVPALPSDTSVNYELFFNSLISGGTDNTILQPEIFYYPKTNGSNAVWTLRSEAFYNAAAPYGFDDKVGGTLDYPVAEGDVVILAVNMISGGGGSGQATTWQIYTYDSNSSLETELYEELTGWGPFNQVYDVYEIHAIDACNGLPSQNKLDFNMDWLSQSSSSNPLTPVEVDSVQSWAGTHVNNSVYSPNCSWGDSPASTGGSPNTLTWAN